MQLDGSFLDYDLQDYQTESGAWDQMKGLP